jgi:endonuclease-3
MNFENNIEKVFNVFRKNYVLVPLEIFGDDPYKTLVSTLMSSRTNDSTTLLAAERLFTKAPNLEELNKLRIEEIEKLIYPVGFYKTKAKQLKKLSQILLTEFSGKVPSTREKLTSLPGVGRKTANLVLNRAFGIPAIAVDTHVHKISNLLGWVKTSTPEKTESALTEFLPKKYWPETNRLFVSIGRQFTTKQRLEDFLHKEKLI